MKKSREKRLIRDSKGRFKRWTGGKKKSELAKKETTFQGIKVHIGKEFKKQHGRKAGLGSIVRTKTKDGTYHKGAFWYIKTVKGWRRFGDRKPTQAVIRKVKRGKMP